MTRPNHVPEDAEDITDYGITENHNPTDPDRSTAEDVWEAIVDAMEAAGEGGSIYVPAGTYYFGSPESTSVPIAIGAREPGGISVYGDDPEESFIAKTEHLNDEENHNGFAWYDDHDHGNVEVRAITFDGNYQNQGDLYAAGTSARGIRILNGADGTFDFYNVQIKNWYSSGIRFNAPAGSVEYCSFIENSIGVWNDGETADQHLTLRPSQSVNVDHCYFESCSGVTMNITGGGGDVNVTNTYAEGCGAGVTKIRDNQATFENCYFKPYTQWMHDNIVDYGGPQRYGWNFWRRNQTDGDPVLITNDVKVEDCWLWACDISNNTQIEWQGDMIAIHNAGMQGGNRDQGVRAETGDLINTDINRISIHNCEGVALDIDDSSDGTIQTLNRDGNTGFGDLGGIVLEEDNNGSDPFQPNVPSESEVGVNAFDNKSDDDNSDEIDDVDSPIPEIVHAWRFDEGTGLTVADSASSADGEIDGANWNDSAEWVGDNALEFGEDSQVRIDSNQFDIGDEGTLTLTARGTYTDTGVERGYAFAHPDSIESNRLYIKADNEDAENKWVARIGDSSQIVIGDIDPAERLRLAVTWDNGEITTYLNGEEQATGNYSTGISLDRLDWFIGTFNRFDRDGDQLLDGQLDNILLSKTAATEEQMQADFEEQPWVTDDGDNDSTEESPLFEDWTPRWDANTADWSILDTDSNTGDTYVELDATDPGYHVVSWDAVGAATDVELLGLVRIPSSDDTRTGWCRLVGRGNTDANGDEHGYWTWLVESGGDYEVRVEKCIAGTHTAIGRVDVSDFINEWVYMRFRIDGSDIKTKYWKYDNQEPASWDIEVSDTDITDSGWSGIGGYSADIQQFDWFSAATGGESAVLPTGDSAPDVSWTSPESGDTVSGTKTIQIDASGAEDEDSLFLEYRIDDNPWLSTSYNPETGYYEDEWDSTAVTNGAYTLEARATDSHGNSSSDSVDVQVDNAPSVETVAARDTTESSTTLVGELTDLGGADAVSVAFEWRDTNQSSWNIVGEQVVDTTGEFTGELTELDSDTAYEFRAVETTSETITGDTRSFRTREEEDEDVAGPVIERFEISDESENGWTRFDIDWTVSDDDGNLDTVVSKLRLADRTVQADSTVVFGERASYSHTLRVRGQVDEVRLTVTDTQNRTTSKAKDV